MGQRKYFSSVSPKGQITLPAEVRHRLGIKARDRTVVTFDRDFDRFESVSRRDP